MACRLILQIAMLFFFSNRIAGAAHQPKMHSCQVFANNAQGKELHAGKNGDDGCKERKPRNRRAGYQVSDHYIRQYKKAKECK